MITEDSKKVITAIGKVKNFTELTPTNLKIFSQAILAVNDFNKKMSHYGAEIFKKHLKTVNEWSLILSEKDFKNSRLDPKEKSDQYVYCYKDKCMIKYGFRDGWSMGATSELKTKYEFNDKGILIVTNSWKTQSARFGHIPWIPRERRFTIDYKIGSVEVSGDHIDTQR